MTNKTIVIMPLAAALGALSSVPATEGSASPATHATEIPQATNATKVEPNTLVSTGKDLLGFLVEKRADGTIVASHTSHASHASHASHHSHYSSR